MRETDSVSLDGCDIKEGWAYHHRVVEKVKSWPNYTGLVTPDRFFVGWCGEKALSIWADFWQLPYELTTNDEGKPDEQDFIFSDKTVNIKNTHHPRGKNLIQPLSQAEKHNYDYLVGASGDVINDNLIRIDIWGAIEYEQFLREAEIREYQNTVRAWPLDKLPIQIHQMRELFKGEG